MSREKENVMTPYLVGAGIGALNAFSFLSAKRGLGVSTAFETLAAQTSQRYAPDITNINSYLKEPEGTSKTDWESLLALGIPIGSFLAARSGRVKEMPKASYESRYLRSFFGGAIMMMGARLGKGCTSGHGITGTSQLALSSLIFTSLMFASAIVTDRFIYKKEKK